VKTIAGNQECEREKLQDVEATPPEIYLIHRDAKNQRVVLDQFISTNQSANDASPEEF